MNDFFFSHLFKILFCYSIERKSMNQGGKAKINFLNALNDTQHKWTGGGSFSHGIATLFFMSFFSRTFLLTRVVSRANYFRKMGGCPKSEAPK